MSKVNYVLVVDTKRCPMTPCHPAQARILLREKRAAVLRMFPFTLVMKVEIPTVNMPTAEMLVTVVKPLRLKIDPGSKTTGFALINSSGQVIFAMELTHRGWEIKSDILTRRGIRQSRRGRNTRYREPRFDNRKRPDGWLPPSLEHRVKTVMTWINRFHRFCNIGSISVERVKFDMQLMRNPDVSGVEYQQGTLAGYSVREYLLEKWQRKCAYCSKEDVPLQIEHIKSKAGGGGNTISNLTLACEPCNIAKGTKSIEVFLKNKPEVLKRILAQVKKPLSDAAAVNATRNALYNTLLETGLPVEIGTGAQTKFNRIKLGYPKAHWIDAACVGDSGMMVKLNPSMKPLLVKATGHGNRQACRTDKYGFPNRYCSRQKIHFGFQTGDIIKVEVVSGKKIGNYSGRIACRASGSFDIQTVRGKIAGISHKCCKIIQHKDGYNYV